MKKCLAEEIYVKFNIHHRRKRWWSFDYCFSLYQERLAFCLDSLDGGKGKVGFTLWMSHLAEMVKQSNLEKIDLVRTVNSFSEQGIAVSFGLNSLVPNNMLYNFLSMSSYGQQILMPLEKCLAIESVGFTVF